MSKSSNREALMNLQALIQKLPKGEERDKLKAQHRDLSEITMTLVEANVASDTGAYVAITAEFEKVNCIVSGGINDIQRVSTYITKIDNAISAAKETLSNFKGL